MSNIALYNALIKAGVSEAQAEKAADKTVSAQDAATKTDIAELKVSVAETNTKIADTNTKIAELRAGVFKWGLVAFITLISTTIGSVGLMARFLAQLIQGG